MFFAIFSKTDFCQRLIKSPSLGAAKMKLFANFEAKVIISLEVIQYQSPKVFKVTPVDGNCLLAGLHYVYPKLPVIGQEAFTLKWKFQQAFSRPRRHLLGFRVLKNHGRLC